MGNCIFVQEKVIKIVKADGKILEYKAPMRVQQVLSEFSGHEVSDTSPALRCLHPDIKLVGGGLYYLVPVPLTSPRVKKKVRFSIPEVEAAGQDKGVVRIKVVISKQELQKILQKEGLSLDEMVSQIQSRDDGCNVEKCNSQDDCEVWKPVLESIPETY